MSVKLNYRIIGQGPPIVFLHGLFGMLDNWVTMAKKFEEAGYMSILVDQRDHGRSPHTDQFNYLVLAQDIQKFCEDNWIYNAVFLGHSMGGKTVMTLAHMYPELIDKLIVVDIAPKKYTPGHDHIFEALMGIDIGTVQDRNTVEHKLYDTLQDKSVVQFLMKNVTRHKSGYYEWKMNLPLLYQSYLDILDFPSFEEIIPISTLFVRGLRSEYILDKDIPQIKNIFSHVTIKDIPDAGHWVHADKPDELFQHLIQFIS